MIGRIYITLDHHAFAELQREAKREMRGVREQATLHILRGLNIHDGFSRPAQEPSEILLQEPKGA
jgi:hypothetical protein